MPSLREVHEILSSEMGDEGFRVKEGPLLELSIPMKPVTWSFSEGPCWEQGAGGTFFGLGAPCLMVKTCGFVVIQILHSCSVVTNEFLG